MQTGRANIIPTRPLCTTWEMPSSKRPKIYDSRVHMELGGPTPKEVVDRLDKLYPLQQGDHLWNRHWVPPDSVEDYVVSLRRQASTPDSAFQWPVNKLTFQKAVEVALHLMPPGHMMIIDH